MQFGELDPAASGPHSSMGSPLAPITSPQSGVSGRSGKPPLPHFVHYPELDLFHHRPRKFVALLGRMIGATAVRRTWPHLLFFGAFSAMVVCINELVDGDVAVPNTLLTPLGEWVPLDRLDWTGRDGGTR